MKKLVLLPLLGILSLSAFAWSWQDVECKNYYNERPWLLPPSQGYWYWSPQVSTYDYTYYASRYYRNPWAAAPVAVLPASGSGASGTHIPYERIPLPERAYPTSRYDNRYRDLDWSGARPVVGYGDLPWGSRVYDLTRRYPDVLEVTEPADLAVDVRRFVQKPVGTDVESRQFVFSSDRLYEVYVLYGYVDDYASQFMGEKLIARYGTPVKTVRRESRTNSAHFQMLDLYMNYSRNLQVVYTQADVYNFYNFKLGTVVTALYVNLPVKAEVERARGRYWGW